MALYLRHVVRGLAAEGAAILLLTTKEAQADPAFQLVKTELPDDAKIFYFELAPQSSSHATISLLRGQVSNWWKLRRAAKKIIANQRPDVAYIPTLDWIAKATEVLDSPFGKLPFVALYMAPKHHRFAAGLGPKSRSDSLYDHLFRRLLRISTLKRIVVIDEIFYEFAKSRYGHNARKITFAPDFAVVGAKKERVCARQRLGISEESKVLLVYGSLTLRKGIRELLEALITEDAPDNLIVLLAGRPSPDVETLLQRPEFIAMARKNRIVTQFKFHDEEEESEVFSASDAVWIGYVHGFFGSSGVLHQSVGFGLPVIASAAGLIGTLVKRFQLGITLEPTQTTTVTSALKEFAEGRTGLSASQEKLSEFNYRYSADEHVRVMLQVLLQDNHIPDDHTEGVTKK